MKFFLRKFYEVLLHMSYCMEDKCECGGTLREVECYPEKRESFSYERVCAMECDKCGKRVYEQE